MILKRFNVGSGAYTIENRGQISKLLKPEYAKPTLAQYEIEQSTSALVDISAKYDNEYHSTSDTPRTSVTSLNTTLGSDVLELLPARAISYQASSPDEIAIVDWTEQIG
ncbi:unnamed protein product, partial [Rotaria magnacalcarata]